MADLRIVDAPVLLQESITDDVKMPTGGLGNFSVRLGDILWYVITKEQLANKNYVDLSSKSVKDSLDEHIADKANPHQVTKAQVGLGNVDNTADVDKPVSNATKSAIITATTDMATKAYVNSKDGDLSTLTTTDKTSLAKAINEVVSVKANKDDVASSISNLTNNKADKATTLTGYGITDTYTKSEIDTNYGGVKTLYDKNVQAEAGAKGWADTLVAAGENLNQRQINDGLESVAQLAGIQNPRTGQRVYVKGYHAPTLFVELNPYKGGNLFVYDATVSRSKHDGGTIIDPTKVFPTDWKNRTQVNDWFLPSNTGTGCWLAQYDGAVNVLWFGAMPDFSLGVDNSIAINRALSVKNNIFLPSGNYIIHRPILTSKANVVIRGDGVDNTLITVENQYWQGTTYNGKTYNSAIVNTSGVDNQWTEAATIQDLTLLGNSYSADGKIGIDFDNVCMRVNVKNVVITAFDKGLHTYKSWCHNYIGVSITDCITNSIHMDTFANGYNFSGCTVYGKSVMTACHIVVENACYGNNFNGGAIEKANIGVTLRNNAQMNINGVDWEVFGLLFMQQINCPDLPSTISACSIMGNPSQSGITTNNGNLIVEGNKIFNPSGTIDNPVFFASGSGKLVLNDNEYGQYTGKLIDGDAKIYGNDLARYDFNKSNRSSDKKVLDAYKEIDYTDFELITSTLAPYTVTNITSKKTQIGNAFLMQTKMNVTQTTMGGDYFIIRIAELTGRTGLVGRFAFSKTNDKLFRDGIFGSIISDNGVCYLVKDSGDLLTKDVLTTGSSDNLFSFNITFIDNI